MKLKMTILTCLVAVLVTLFLVPSDVVSATRKPGLWAEGWDGLFYCYCPVKEPTCVCVINGGSAPVNPNPSPEDPNL